MRVVKYRAINPTDNNGICNEEFLFTQHLSCISTKKSLADEIDSSLG